MKLRFAVPLGVALVLGSVPLLAQEMVPPACASAAGPAFANLTLSVALRQVVCASPAVRQAGSKVDDRLGVIAVTRSTYLPRVSLQGEVATNQIPSINSAAPYLASSASAALRFSWLLVDFGARSAATRQAGQELKSAQSAWENALLASFRNGLKLYTDAITSHSRLGTLAQAEEVARQTLAVVQAKKDAQAGSLVEVLQARTALAQAQVDHGRAVGTWETARGTLAVAMGYPASQSLNLAPIADSLAVAGPDIAADLPMVDALEQHPLLRSLRADIDAAKARIDTIRAESWGTIAVGGSVGGTQSLLSGTNYGQISTSVALIATIPIYDGGDRNGRTAQAVAQLAIRMEELESARREIEVVVHAARQAVETERLNVDSARTLRTIATEAYEVSLGRYKAGVGSLLDLLTAQNAATSAQSQLLQAEIGWVSARVYLAIAEGRFKLS